MTRLVCLIALVAVCVGIGRASLIDRWRAKQVFTVVAFGDSITAGMGLSNPEVESFPSIVSELLRELLPRSRVQLVNKGRAGELISGALQRVDEDVIALQPDLVMIQFGGNDQRLGVPLWEAERDLTEIIHRIRQRSTAQIVLVVPPFQRRQPNSDFAEAIRGLGIRENVAVADCDSALRVRPHDFRGWFSPPPSHPTAYSHAIMAQEVWRALHELLGVNPKLRAVVPDMVLWSDLETPLVVPIVVENLSPQRSSVLVRVSAQYGRTYFQDESQLPPNGKGEVKFSISPPSLPVRSWKERLWVIAKAQGSVNFHVGWVSWSPVIASSLLHMNTLEHIRVGASSWRGEEDLSVQAKLSLERDMLCFHFDVTDDRVLPKLSWDFRSVFEGDCIEVYLDHRPPKDQGKPFYDENVTMMLLIPGESTPRFAKWSFEEVPPSTVPPPERWEGLKMKSKLHKSGYLIELTVPLKAFSEQVRDAGCIGFDFMVDDADGWGRESQLIAFGWEENFRDPSLLATLVWKEPLLKRKVRVRVY